MRHGRALEFEHASPPVPWDLGSVLAGGALTLAQTHSSPAAKAPDKTHVLVWDERQPAQNQAYDNFLGNAIADHLRGQGLSVKSASLDDPDQGLSETALDDARVLIWWGHVRHAEVSFETARRIVSRIKEGRLSLVALHSAHWSTPFVEAMNERSRMELAKTVASRPDDKFEIHEIPAERFKAPSREARLTPYVEYRKKPGGTAEANLHMPNCCFPAYRGDGKPSEVRVLTPEHRIASGLPKTFELEHTEMYDEPFHVPEPDEVIFEMLVRRFLVPQRDAVEGRQR